MYVEDEVFNLSLPITLEDKSKVVVIINALSKLHKVEVSRLPWPCLEGLKKALSPWGKIVASGTHHKYIDKLEFFFRDLQNEDLVKVNRITYEGGA